MRVPKRHDSIIFGLTFECRRVKEVVWIGRGYSVSFYEIRRILKKVKAAYIYIYIYIYIYRGLTATSRQVQGE